MHDSVLTLVQPVYAHQLQYNPQVSMSFVGAEKWHSGLAGGLISYELPMPVQPVYSPFRCYVKLQGVVSMQSDQ